MKKVLIALGIVVLITGASYSVYDFNKSSKNSPNKSTGEKNTSLVNPSNSSKENTSAEQQVSANSSQNQNKEEKFKLKAIDFKLKDLSGKEVSLSEFKGKRVFLNFWASWCPPCKAEMPEMEALYKETQNSDLVILAVNLGENKSTVEKFIKDNNYTFPVLLDSDNEAAVNYRVVSIPTSFFIDKDGTIVDKHIGSMTIDDMKAYIKKIQ